MKVDNVASSVFVRQAPGINQSRNDDSASFAASLAAKAQETSNSAADSRVKQVDFTNMTRQEMRDWTNNQIRSGQMSLDESMPFMAMTMKLPVGGGAEIPAETDNERIDFMQRARQGLEGAQSRRDARAAERLEIALSIMLKNQGQTIGVNLVV